MLGTSKKHDFHVKWKMFPHVPPTYFQMFCNTLVVVLGILNEQCVGERLCVPFVNRLFEFETLGTVNFTNFCFVLLLTWRSCLRFLCRLRENIVLRNVFEFDV